MFRNNLKITFRLFKRNKTFTLINVLGMSTGMAISMLIILYARFELSYEDYNPNSDRMVRITMDYLDGETVVEQDCETYPPLGPKMNREFTEIESYTRAYGIDERTLKVGDKFYREPNIYAADSTFFDLFHYPFLYGNQEEAFRKPYELVLTESMALKFFNRLDVVGEMVEFVSAEAPFQVVGVIPDCPPNTHLKFTMLISYLTMYDFGEKEDNWNGNNTLTYFLLEEQATYASFLTNLDRFNEKLLDEELLENEIVLAQRARDIHLYSDKSFEAEKNGDATSVYFLLGVALLVIIIAVVNYINLSTSKSLDRAREVGIKKVIGSTINQLRVQFFTESIIINLMAGLLGVGLIILLQPSFRQIAGLPESINFFTDPLVWAILGAIIIVSSVLSGIFPALVLSAFQPIRVLKGEFTYSSTGSLLRKSLVVFQFSITIFLLIQTLTASEQLTFMREKDMGLNMEQTIVVRAPQMDIPEEKYHTFKDKLLEQAQFQDVAMTSCVPGMPSSQMSTSTGITLVGAAEDHYFNFYLYWVDEDFFRTMQMELLAGENYLPNSPNEGKVIVNEESIRLWGIPSPEEAVGQSIDMWGEQRIISGVIKNFHQATAKSAHIPIIFMYQSGFHDLASIRSVSGDLKHQLETVKATYEQLFPHSPFNYFFLDQEFDKQYRADEQFQQVFSSLTGLAIVIACLGLFGLVSFTVAKRTKEIGIRKVLGANVSQITMLLSKDFVSLILVAMCIAIPSTYFLIEKWLSRYAFRIDLTGWLFIVPAILVLTIAVLTISGKTIRVSGANPANALRDQ